MDFLKKFGNLTENFWIQTQEFGTFEPFLKEINKSETFEMENYEIWKYYRKIMKFGNMKDDK